MKTNNDNDYNNGLINGETNEETMNVHGRVWRIIRRVLEYFLHIKNLLIRQVLQVLYIYNINTMYERILMKIGKMSFWVTNLHNFVE